MARILLIGLCDGDSVPSLQETLRQAGYEVAVAVNSGCDTRVTGTIITWVAADGTALAPRLRRALSRTHLMPTAVESVGASETCAALLSFHTRLAEGQGERHSLSRWAKLVLSTLPLEADPTTLHAWGRAIGVSRGALRNWCRTSRLPARQSLLFARVLRAIVRHQHTGDAAEDLLDVADRRTLVKLLAVAGGTPHGLPATVDDFLVKQQLIKRQDALDAVRRALAGTALDLRGSHVGSR